MPKTEVYIGKLDRDVQQEDIEGVFSKYGKIKRCDLKNKGLSIDLYFLILFF
jgi:RNA recognition motif-containing protein